MNNDEVPELEELWKDISGYKGHYQISNFGRVKSLKRNSTRSGTDNRRKTTAVLSERVLKYNVSDKCRYLTAGLCLNGKVKSYRIHRLVAKAFIPNPNNYEWVLHSDDNPRNNTVGNLRWGTPKDNTRDRFINNPDTSKLSESMKKRHENPTQKMIDGRRVQKEKMSRLHENPTQEMVKERLAASKRLTKSNKKQTRPWLNLRNSDRPDILELWSNAENFRGVWRYLVSSNPGRVNATTITKHLKIKYTTVFTKMISMFEDGWLPNNDPLWINFKMENNNEE